MTWLNDLDNEIFDTDPTTYHDATHVAGEIYVVAYTRDYTDGYVTSLRITAEGVATLLDTIQYSAVNLTHKKVVVLDANVFAVFSSNVGGGYIHTLSVDLVTGALANIDNRVFDASSDELTACHIDGTQYAIFYQGPGGDGWLRTWSIADNGVIAALETDSWEWGPVTGEGEDIYHIPGTLIYIGISFNNVFTFQIANNGIIAPFIIDTFALTANADHPRLTPVSGTIYAFVYRDPAGASGGDLTLDTLDIDNAGNIAGALTDTWSYFDQGHDASIMRLTFYADVFWIFHTGYTGAEHYVRGIQITIDNAGNIGALVDCGEFSTQDAFGNSSDDNGDKVTLPINGTNLIACVWRDYDGGFQGMLTTVGFQPTVTTQVPTRVLTEITAHGNVTVLGEPDPTHGFCYSETDTTPDIGDSLIDEGIAVGVGAFSAVIPLLVSGNTYYLRSFAYNGAIVAYGPVETFIAQWEPIPQTLPATEVT